MSKRDLVKKLDSLTKRVKVRRAGILPLIDATKLFTADDWRAFAAYYYGAYVLNGVAILATLGWIGSTGDFFLLDKFIPIPGPLSSLACVGCVVLLALSFAWYRTRSASRMLSTISLGDAKLTVRIRTAALFGQFIAYIVSLAALLLLLGLTAAIVIASIYAVASSQGATGSDAIVTLFQSSTTNVALLILAYLVVLGAFGLLAELILAETLR